MANISVLRFVIVYNDILCLFFYRYDIIVFILLMHNTCPSDKDFTNRNSYSNQWFDKSLWEAIKITGRFIAEMGKEFKNIKVSR